MCRAVASWCVLVCLNPVVAATRKAEGKPVGPPLSPCVARAALTYTRFTDKGVIYVFGDAENPAVCDGAFLTLPYRAFVPPVGAP